MNGPGQPSLYKTEYRELAHNYCLLGATNPALAAFFNVAPRTIDNWIANGPEFAAAVRAGRADADARVARGLYTRAVGYDRAVERTQTCRCGEKTVKTTAHYPPDTQACMFWLRNRQRHYWQAREEAAPAVEDDLAAALDAAAESVRHAGD